ncbi:MAG: hypothetical protein IKV07_03130 [Bacteroidaceae bacterium]|nr:hypothetical protein [Bacteroidaceae bacterium]
MKKIFGALVIALLAIGANAQTFEKGSSIATAQLGIGGGFGQRVAYEYSLMNLLDGKAAIGVGGSVANLFWSTKVETNYYNTKDAYDNITLAAIGSFHYEFIDKLDTYVTLGLGFGFGINNFKQEYKDRELKKYDVKDSSTHGYFGWISSLGARWYFNKNWAANVELGWTGAGYFAVGATYKF